MNPNNGYDNQGYEHGYSWNSQANYPQINYFPPVDNYNMGFNPGMQASPYNSQIGMMNNYQPNSYNYYNNNNNNNQMMPNTTNNPLFRQFNALFQQLDRNGNGVINEDGNYQSIFII